jgi:acyl-CoA reductase-like NAD-dependent aldehyde dehydrogenase
VLCGKPKEIIDCWLEHPGVNDIFYFGGSQEGLRFERDCISHGKKPILELAGNDGVLVWRDADLDQAAEAVTECFFGSGQICMVPNYVVVHPAVADAFIERVRALAAGIRPGLPDDDDVLLSPVRRSESFFALLDQATGVGAQMICGGQRIELDGTRSDTGVFLEPTVLRVNGLSKARSLDAVRHETFFPLLPMIVPEYEEDEALLRSMVEFINANEYGLRNSVWARSPEIIESCVAGIRNGGLLKVNDTHIGFVPYLASHGGTGLTGGVFGEANYPILRTSHLQGVCIGAGTSPRIAAFTY